MADKYSWRLYLFGTLMVDLSGYAENRKITITRNDSDQISFSLSVDTLYDLCSRLKMSPPDLLQVNRIETRILRGGLPLTAGELLSWKGSLGLGRTINFNVCGWFDLLKQRRTSDTYTSQTAAQIAQSVFNTSMAKPYGLSGNFNGFTANAFPSPDNTNIYALKAYQDKTVYDVIKELSTENNGFDFEMTWDKKFNIYHPMIGSNRPDIIFTYPGNVKNIEYDVDGSKTFNSLLARGQGSGSTQLQTMVTDATSQIEYGLREDVRDYSDINDLTQLINLSSSDQSTFNNPLLITTITFDGAYSASPQVGSFHIGDRVAVSIKKNALQTINNLVTIDKIEINIGKEDEEEVTLSVH